MPDCPAPVGCCRSADYPKAKVIEDLPRFALQAGEEKSTIQGNKFENYVIDLLGLTIFDARHIGGQNNTDGIIVLYYHGGRKPNILYPVEVKSFKPEAIVHLGEIPSAPYSMIDIHHCNETMMNNIIGTNNILFAMNRFDVQVWITHPWFLSILI